MSDKVSDRLLLVISSSTVSEDKAEIPTTEEGNAMPPEVYEVVILCTSVAGIVNNELKTRPVGTFVIVRYSPFKNGLITVL